jgi:hypothetical protein
MTTREPHPLEAGMKHSLRSHATALIASASLIAAACGGHDKSGAANGDVATPAGGAYSTPAATPTASSAVDTTRAHHSKMRGAMVGAAAGHMLGGHAMLGAAAGALVQHERNKPQ